MAMKPGGGGRRGGAKSKADGEAGGEAETGWLPIGEFARRAGVAVSALRFYEAQGLLGSRRSEGGRRLYRRADLRRVAFVRVAQSVGLRLADVRASLAALPDGRTPTRADWERLSRQWQPLLQERIDLLVRLQQRLASCIGCGCLSLKSCALVNPGDVIAVRGPGARYVLGDAMAEPGPIAEQPAERAPSANARRAAGGPGRPPARPAPRATAKGRRPQP